MLSQTWRFPTAPALLRARTKPLQVLIREFFEKTRAQVITGLAVQHAGLCEGQVKSLTRSCDRYVHQTPLFFKTLGFG